MKALTPRVVARLQADQWQIARRQRVRILGAHDRWIRVARGERFRPYSSNLGGWILYVDQLTGRCGTASEMLASGIRGWPARRVAAALRGAACSR
jgi:hypothetical protein